MEVAEQNSCLRAGNDQDDEDQEKEAKHVIHLMRPAEKHCTVRTKTSILKSTHFSMIWFQIIPNAVEDEEELDEDAAKGQDAAHDDARHGFGEEGLLRNLAWDLVCSHWWLDALLKQENKNTPTFMISCMTACQKKSSHRWETQ